LYSQEVVAEARFAYSVIPIRHYCSGGPNFTAMLSKCDDCVHQSECCFNQSWPIFIHESHDHKLVDRDRWRTIAHQRPDAHNVICEAFNMGPLIKAKTEDNSEDPTHRFADVLHHLYHRDNSITWERIIAQIITIDDHLAEVIRNSIPYIQVKYYAVNLNKIP